MQLLKKHDEIYWGELKGSSLGDECTFLCGSTIRVYQNREIYFENRLMVSGQMIHEWCDSFNYQGDRLTPSLPLLKKGHAYTIKAEMDLIPASSVFLKIIFFDRYRKELSSVVSKTQSLDFIYPKEAYNYRVQLLNAGLEEMHFRYIMVKKQEKVT